MHKELDDIMARLSSEFEPSSARVKDDLNLDDPASVAAYLETHVPAAPKGMARTLKYDQRDSISRRFKANPPSYEQLTRYTPNNPNIFINASNDVRVEYTEECTGDDECQGVLIQRYGID